MYTARDIEAFFARIELRSERFDRATSGEVDQLEAELGLALPAGYREYVTRLGFGCYTGLIRIYIPGTLRREWRGWREFIGKYYFWDASADLLSKVQVLESVRLGDTLNGDAIIYHPCGPTGIFVLPRHDEYIHKAGNSLYEAIDWICDAGILLSRLGPYRYFEPYNRKRIRYSLTSETGLTDLADQLALLRIHDHVVPLMDEDEDEDGRPEVATLVYIVKEFGGDFSLQPGDSSDVFIVHDKGTDSPKLRCLAAFLESAGFERHELPDEDEE